MIFEILFFDLTPFLLLSLKATLQFNTLYKLVKKYYVLIYLLRMCRNKFNKCKTFSKNGFKTWLKSINCLMHLGFDFFCVCVCVHACVFDRGFHFCKLEYAECNFFHFEMGPHCFYEDGGEKKWIVNMRLLFLKK